MGTIDVTCPQCGTNDIHYFSVLGQYLCNDCGWKWGQESQAINIGELSESVGFKHTPEFDPPITWTKGSAATDWFPYRADSIFSPSVGEWCLWSKEINRERNYFTGSLIERNGFVVISADGWDYFEPDETTYWARVRYIHDKQKGEK